MNPVNFVINRLRLRKNLKFNHAWEVKSHAKETMPVLPPVVCAASAELPSTKDLFEGGLPGLEDPEEMEELESEESILWTEPQSQAQKLEAGSSAVLEGMAQEASGICFQEPEGAESAGCPKKRISCKTNRLERNSTWKIKANRAFK